MLKYFSNCTTQEELKKAYWKLALKHHPDHGGDTATMQAINAEYEEIFPRLKNKHKTASGSEYEQETTETANQYPDIISAIIRFVGITIEICGTWVWVSGNTRKYKDQFKALGFKWARKKCMWYWRADENKARFCRTHYSMNDIRAKYGSERVTPNPDPVLS